VIESASAGTGSTEVRPDIRTFLLFWLRFGCINFGGPAGQIALMQTELVDRRRWIDQQSFLHGLNFCMMLPGPEAQQLATFTGWRLFGLRGGLIAGGLFILPGALLLLGLSWLTAAHGDQPWLAGFLAGVNPVVVAVILTSLLRISHRTLSGWFPVLLAITAFLALTLLSAPFPLVVATAALAGIVRQRFGPHPATVPFGEGAQSGPLSFRADAGRILRLCLLFALAMGLPVLAVLLLVGPAPYAALATLFTKAAFVTFGGAYAVLPYVAESAVHQHGWLSPAQMLNGMALAESTPGPLILVVQYIGFYAGWNQPGNLSPLWAGILAAGLSSWVTFLPGFLFIAVGAPHLNRLIRQPVAAAALNAITAAIVGVIASLAFSFGAQVLWPGAPNLTAINLTALALTAAALLLHQRLQTHWLVLLGGSAGMVIALLPP
jgi:chromate transporter